MAGAYEVLQAGFAALYNNRKYQDCCPLSFKILDEMTSSVDSVLNFLSTLT